MSRHNLLQPAEQHGPNNIAYLAVVCCLVYLIATTAAAPEQANPDHLLVGASVKEISVSERSAEGIGLVDQKRTVWSPLTELSENKVGDGSNLQSLLSAGHSASNNLDDKESPPHLQLVSSINEIYEPKPMTWSRAMSDELATVVAAGVWWSSKPRHQTAVTLVTQATVDRIPQIFSQCMSWTGPLSVAVYVGLHQAEDSLGKLNANSTQHLKMHAEKVDKLFKVIEASPNMCQLDIILVFEQYTEQEAMMLYPINVLRNIARVQARSPLLALVDVDMLIGSSFSASLNDEKYTSHLLEGVLKKSVYVLPAFEIFGLSRNEEAAALADLVASRSKYFLLDLVRKGVLEPFDARRFTMGHICTNYLHWYQTDQEYAVQYEYRYEPWVVVSRTLAPWHDARFRGYGNNKIVHVAHLNASGFKFMVLPQAFIIHRAHEETPMRKELVASKYEYGLAVKGGTPVNTSSIYSHTKMLFDGAVEAMHAGNFIPAIDRAVQNCITKLAWWQ